MTDEELKNLVASLAQAQKEISEVQKELSEAQKKTDEELKSLVASLAQTHKELFEAQKKTDEQIKKLSQMYGGVSNNQGKVAEEFFFNTLKHKPVLNGIRFDYIEKNVTRSKGNLEEEYDIILVTGKIVYLIEVKYKLHLKDMQVFLERKYPNFFKLYPEYNDYEVRLAFASFFIDTTCKEFAKEHKITLLQRRGKLIETLAA